MDSIEALQNKAGVLQRDIDKISGMRDQLLQEKASKLVQLQESTEYLDQSAQVLAALGELHLQAQRKSKELYENLLTTQIRELMPHNNENGRVVLRNYISKARPALSVEVETQSGMVRDVYEDKGGSIESILAVGLRFICLSRTANRRFIVFDEADAGLNAKYMPKFAAMLEQLATQIGVQVIYITHHPRHMLEGKGRVIELESDQGKIVSNIVSDYEYTGPVEGVNDEAANDFFEDTGIEYLRLVNVKQHENTLIDLCPYVNFIIGDNDIGKTTVTQAIEAVAHNKGRTGLIRDGESYCSLEVGLEGGMSLDYRYSRSGSKKTRYKLFDDQGQEVQTSDSGTKKPEWLDDYLAMPIVNGIDLHISDQHNSSFILDKRFSEHQKAEILNIDDDTDASITQKMLARHTEITDFHKKRKRTLAQEISELNTRLEKIRMINTAEEQLAESMLQLESAQKATSEEISIEALIKRWQQIDSFINTAKQVDGIELPKQAELVAMTEISSIAKNIRTSSDAVSKLSLIANTELPQINQLQPSSEVLSLTTQIEETEAILKKLAPIADAALPSNGEIKETTSIMKFGSEIAKSSKMIQVLSKVSSVDVEKVAPLSDMASLRSIGRLVKQHGDNSTSIQGNISQLEIKLDNKKKEMEEIVSKIDVCPLCKSVKHKGQECA